MEQYASVADFLKQHKSSSLPYCFYGARKIAYSEMHAAVESFSGLLLSAGATGQNVALFCENTPEYICAYFANAYAGNTNIPINTALTDPEIISEVEYCDCNWIICRSEHAARLMKLAGSLGCGIISIDNYLHASIICNPQSRRVRQNDSSIAVMLHTSGTTGNPKKVMLTHENLIANTWSNIQSLSLTKDDKVLIVLPMFFGYCHTGAFPISGHQLTSFPFTTAVVAKWKRSFQRPAL